MTTESVTFSGKSGGNPVIRLRLIDNSVPERTEQLRVLISLPPLLEFGLILENTSTTILILDNDGQQNTDIYTFKLSDVCTVEPLSNLGTNRGEESVLVREVSSFQMLKCMQDWYLGWEKVSCLKRCPKFSRERFHCIKFRKNAGGPV